MPKIQNSTKPFIVSFNGSYGDFDIGDTWYHSADLEGDDIDELAKEVIEDDPHFPLIFIKNEDHNSPIVGFFYSEDEVDEEDRYPTAVMMTNEYFYD